MGNGVGSLRLNTVRAVALTSISPVFIFGFTLAPRLTTFPWTPMHHSRRSVPARAWASGSISGSKTTWVHGLQMRRSVDGGATFKVEQSVTTDTYLKFVTPVIAASGNRVLILLTEPGINVRLLRSADDGSSFTKRAFNSGVLYATSVSEPDCAWKGVGVGVAFGSGVVAGERIALNLESATADGDHVEVVPDSAPPAKTAAKTGTGSGAGSAR